MPRFGGSLATSTQPAIFKRSAGVGIRPPPGVPPEAPLGRFGYERLHLPVGDECPISFLTDHIFSGLERPGSKTVTSTITMTELLALAYRDSDDHRVDEFYGLLSTYPNLDWIAPHLEIADFAARFRALHRLRTPHAPQAATAVHAGSTGLITNDAAFERVEMFETMVLDRLL